MRILVALSICVALASTPETFAPGVVSTAAADELNAAFTPDGREVYFTRTNAPAANRTGTIMVSRRAPNGTWSAPETASFSGQFPDFDPFVSPDGKRLFFISKRPAAAGDSVRADFDMWVVDRQGRRWGAARRLDGALNSNGHELYPTAAADGTLYFSSCGRPDSRGGCDLYRARLRDGRYDTMENLGDAVNGPTSESDMYVAPDQSYLVFVSDDRPGGAGGSDLYVSRALPGGGWSAPHPLGPDINTPAREYCPIVSPDGKWFYFTRQPATKLGDVYRVPVATLYK